MKEALRDVIGTINLKRQRYENLRQHAANPLVRDQIETAWEEYQAELRLAAPRLMLRLRQPEEEEPA